MKDFHETTIANTKTMDLAPRSTRFQMVVSSLLFDRFSWNLSSGQILFRIFTSCIVVFECYRKNIEKQTFPKQRFQYFRMLKYWMFKCCEVSVFLLVRLSLHFFVSLKTTQKLFSRSFAPHKTSFKTSYFTNTQGFFMFASENRVLSMAIDDHNTNLKNTKEVLSGAQISRESVE